MNGAAMDCRPENVLRSQHKEPSGLRSPGYHLQISHPHLQNSHPQHSKAMNYKSLSDHFIDGSDGYFQHADKYSIDKKHGPGRGEVRDPRSWTSKVCTRELPLDLPVPQFEVDENYVGELISAKDNTCLVENSKDLDLDTRIDLLIRSKALAGMHPIFSELDQSEDSSPDSDSFVNKCKSKHKSTKRRKSLTHAEEQAPAYVESFDDPETPLSRPPSPFLSRATYLFWFNKAIELKQQAKAQEKALLEKATKKILHDGLPTVKKNDGLSQDKKPLLKTLLDEVCNELREIVKQEFIKEVIENTAFSTLEDWWEQERVKEENMVGGNSEKNFATDKVNPDNWEPTSPKLPLPKINDDMDVTQEMLGKNKSMSENCASQRAYVPATLENTRLTDMTMNFNMKSQEQANMSADSSNLSEVNLIVPNKPGHDQVKETRSVTCPCSSPPTVFFKTDNVESEPTGEMDIAIKHISKTFLNNEVSQNIIKLPPSRDTVTIEAEILTNENGHQRLNHNCTDDFNSSSDECKDKAPLE